MAYDAKKRSKKAFKLFINITYILLNSQSQIAFIYVNSNNLNRLSDKNTHIL